MRKQVHVVLPNDIDDPARPSGGNVYDRRVCDGLAGLGWEVHEHAVRGDWPDPSPAQVDGLTEVLASLPADAVILIDGLIASRVPGVKGLIPLVHMPFGDDIERAALSGAAAIVTTSRWSRDFLVERHGLPAALVHIAEPGVDPAPLATPSAAGSRLLCVATIARHKGHDVLVEALGKLGDLEWGCVCVGRFASDSEADPEFETLVRGAGRVTFTGPLRGAALDAAYAHADLLVLPSRGESYGMVAAEALARGVPVLATDVGGLSEAVGEGGVLVPPGDPVALAGELRRWLTDPAWREFLRAAGRKRRRALNNWAGTCVLLARVLSGVEVRCA